MSFAELLTNAGWSEHEPFTYRKGNWIIVFDTSSWLEVGTDKNPRVFDVPVPEDGKAEWTLSLINHLCKTDDELQKLKAI
jgi:hypothetical protein